MRRLAASLGLVVVLVVGGAEAPSVAAARPAAQADRASAALGESVRIEGSGWDWHIGVLDVEICGNLALNGSADCDLANTVEPGVLTDGTFTAAITVTAPPTPCPCLIRIGYPGSPDAVSLPLQIPSLPSRSPEAAASVHRSVSVANVQLQGSGPWTSWFGGAPARVLVFSVTNTGTVVLHHPATDIVFGRGDHPSGFVAPPDIGDLGVGQTRTFRVRVPFGALSVGSYSVAVSVDPTGAVGSGQTSTTVVPLGLVVAGLVLVQLLILAIRQVLRRRVALRTAADPGTALDAGALSLAPPPPALLGPAPLRPAVEAVRHDWAGPWLPRPGYLRNGASAPGGPWLPVVITLPERSSRLVSVERLNGPPDVAADPGTAPLGSS